MWQPFFSPEIETYLIFFIFFFTLVISLQSGILITTRKRILLGWNIIDFSIFQILLFPIPLLIILVFTSIISSLNLFPIWLIDRTINTVKFATVFPISGIILVFISLLLPKADYGKKDFFSILGDIPNHSSSFIKSKFNNHEGAIKDYSKIIEKDPNNFLAYINRGLQNGILGNFIEAIYDYNNALNLRPKSKNALFEKDLAINAIKNIIDENFSLQWCKDNLVVPLALQTREKSLPKLTISIGNTEFLESLKNYLHDQFHNEYELDFVKKPIVEIEGLLNQLEGIKENKGNGLKKKEIKSDINFYKSSFLRSFQKTPKQFPFFSSLAKHLINLLISFVSFYFFLILFFLTIFLIGAVLGSINLIFNLNIILPISHHLELIAIIGFGGLILTILFFYQVLTPLLKRISGFKGSLIRFKFIYGTLYLLSVPINTIVLSHFLTDP